MTLFSFRIKMSDESPFENILKNIKNIFEAKTSDPSDIKLPEVPVLANKSFIKIPANLTKEKIDNEINEIFSKETGLDRIKELFKFEYVFWAFIFLGYLKIKFQLKSETTGKRSEFLEENTTILTSVFTAGFILVAILKVSETQENFRKHNALTVYVDKKASAVNLPWNLKFE